MAPAANAEPKAAAAVKALKVGTKLPDYTLRSEPWIRHPAGEFRTSASEYSFSLNRRPKMTDHGTIPGTTAPDYLRGLAHRAARERSSEAHAVSVPRLRRVDRRHPPGGQRQGGDGKALRQPRRLSRHRLLRRPPLPQDGRLDLRRQ